MRRRLLALAAAGALLAGLLIPRLPPFWGLALGLLAVLGTIGLIAAELVRAMPGDLHLARAWLGLRTRRAPARYVQQLFDSYAGRYDRHLFVELDYRVPNLLRDLVGTRLDGTVPVVADLGCGTGALAPLFRRLAGRLEGVDLSPGMLARARARGLYDELHEGDLLEFLHERPDRFDLLLLADVMPYLGEPGPLLAAAGTALRAEGRLALSAESGTVPGTSLRRSGRFAHEPAALAALARSAGLLAEAERAAVLRREAGRPVEGFVLLLKKVPP